MRDLLQRSGSTQVWLYPESVNINNFTPIFKRRLIDIFISHWRTEISATSSLVLFVELKQNFELSPYIEIVKSYKLRNQIARIRLSSHSLNIEKGRHQNITRSERKCNVCPKNDIEDEFHFILVCPLYDHIREQYIHKYFYKRPSVFKLIELINSTRSTTITSLSLFLKHAFKTRNNELSND